MPSRKPAAKTAAAPSPLARTRGAAGRSRAARSDASLARMQSTIEEAFGLPTGSVKLVSPGKRNKLDETSTVGDLRALWADQ